MTSGFTAKIGYHGTESNVVTSYNTKEINDILSLSFRDSEAK